MSVSIRPVHVPSAKACDFLQQRAQTALDEWAREWVSGWASIERQRATLQMCLASEAAGPRNGEYQEWRADAGRLWFRRDVADRSGFGCAVVGAALMPRSTAADDWIAGVIEHAWDALAHTLYAVLFGARAEVTSPGSTTGLPADLFACGSGAVQLSCDSIGLHAIADDAVWRSVPPIERAAQPMTKLTPLEGATQRARVRLEVTLGSVGVLLPDFLGLQRGDVLRLPQRLDQPLTVLCAGKPLGRAALGETQGRKSVQIVSNEP